jgi:hypothetical protein
MEDIVISLVGGGFFAALVSGVIQIVLWRMNRKAKLADNDDAAHKAIRAGLRIILYDRIKHLCKVYIARGAVAIEELEDLTAMHNVYHGDLGGNGFLDKLMKQVNELPIGGEER